MCHACRNHPIFPRSSQLHRARHSRHKKWQRCPRLFRPIVIARPHSQSIKQTSHDTPRRADAPRITPYTAPSPRVADRRAARGPVGRASLGGTAAHGTVGHCGAKFGAYLWEVDPSPLCGLSSRFRPFPSPPRAFLPSGLPCACSPPSVPSSLPASAKDSAIFASARASNPRRTRTLSLLYPSSRTPH